MRRAVELHQFAFASDAQTSLAMSGSATFTGRTEALAAQQATEGFAAEREAFQFGELFAQVMVIEAGATVVRANSAMRSRTRCGRRR